MPKALKFTNGQNITVLTSHNVSEILNSKVNIWMTVSWLLKYQFLLYNSNFSFSTDFMGTLEDDSWFSLWVKQAVVWARNRGPDKDIGTLGGQSLEPLWEGPYEVILSSPTNVKVPGINSWVYRTGIKKWHPDPLRLSHVIFMSLFSLILLFTF